MILKLFGCEVARISWYRMQSAIAADRLIVELAEERGRVLEMKMELEKLRKQVEHPPFMPGAPAHALRPWSWANPVTLADLNQAFQVVWAWRRRRRLEGSREAGFCIRVSAPDFRPVTYWNSDAIEAVDLYCKVTGAHFDLVRVEVVPEQEERKP